MSTETLQKISDELLATTRAGRTTIRVNAADDFFPIVAETLTPGARSFRDYSMAWVEHAPTPIYEVVSGQRRMLVQTDCALDERPPPAEIMHDYGVKAQMVAPVVCEDALIALIAVHELNGPRHWTSEDVAALEHAITRVSAALASRDDV